MIARTTHNGDRLYVGRSLAFLARRQYVDPWGGYKVEGVLFDLQGGSVQRQAVAYCNLPASESEIVAAALAQAGDR